MQDFWHLQADYTSAHRYFSPILTSGGSYMYFGRVSVVARESRLKVYQIVTEYWWCRSATLK